MKNHINEIKNCETKFNLKNRLGHHFQIVKNRTFNKKKYTPKVKMISNTIQNTNFMLPYKIKKVKFKISYHITRSHSLPIYAQIPIKK